MRSPDDLAYAELHRPVPKASIEPMHTPTPAIVQILDIVLPACGAIGLFVGLVAELVGAGW